MSRPGVPRVQRRVVLPSGARSPLPVRPPSSAPRRRRADGELARSGVGDVAAASSAFAVAGTSTASPALSGTMCMPPPRPRSPRRPVPVHRLAQLSEPRFRTGPADRDLRLAADGQRQELCDPPARQLPARALVLEADGRREGDAGLTGGRPRSAVVTSTGSMRPAARPAARAPAAPARARSSPPATSWSSLRPVWPGTTSIPSPRRTSFASTGGIDRLGEAGELEVERGAVGLHRRRDLGAEEPRLEAAETPDGAEALALAGGHLDRRGPVGLDAECVALIGYRSPPAVKTTGTRATWSKRCSSSVRACFGVRPPTSTPAICDALGDPRRRACERESDQRDEDREQRQRDEHPAGDQAR